MYGKQSSVIRVPTNLFNFYNLLHGKTSNLLFPPFYTPSQPETNIHGELEQKVLLSVHFSDTVNSQSSAGGLSALWLIRNLQIGPIYTNKWKLPSVLTPVKLY